MRQHGDGSGNPGQRPWATPARTSLRKCMPSTMRDTAMLSARKNKRAFERGIKVADDERNGKRRHRVARWKRKLVRRQHLRPAVRLDLARPRPLAQHLQGFEHKNAQNRGGPGGRRWLKNVWRAAKSEQHQAPVRTKSSHRPCAWRRSSRSEPSAGRASDSSGASAGDRGDR